MRATTSRVMCDWSAYPAANDKLGEIRNGRGLLTGQPEEPLQPQDPLQLLRTVADRLVELAANLALAEPGEPAELVERREWMSGHPGCGVHHEIVEFSIGSPGARSPPPRSPPASRLASLGDHLFPWRGAMARPEVPQGNVLIQQCFGTLPEQPVRDAGPQADGDDLGPRINRVEHRFCHRPGDVGRLVVHPDDVDAAVGNDAGSCRHRGRPMPPEADDMLAEMWRRSKFTVGRAWSFPRATDQARSFLTRARLGRQPAQRFQYLQVYDGPPASSHGSSSSFTPSRRSKR